MWPGVRRLLAWGQGDTRREERARLCCIETRSCSRSCSASGWSIAADVVLVVPSYCQRQSTGRAGTRSAWGEPDASARRLARRLWSSTICCSVSTPRRGSTSLQTARLSSESSCAVEQRNGMVHAYIHTYIHTYIRTYVYVHTYVHTYIRTYARTYIRT